MYLLFAGDQYYPLKGWKNYKGQHATIEEALSAATNTECDWWQIVDVAQLSMVRSGKWVCGAMFTFSEPQQ